MPLSADGSCCAGRWKSNSSCDGAAAQELPLLAPLLAASPAPYPLLSPGALLAHLLPHLLLYPLRVMLHLCERDR